ncbi:alpha/beta-hydrolase [Saitoella complicata NRRL Y-17804]|uniref:AB hydrolase-1 domain-containing protein n=1 Tax=Saitoella complicata (strain BCRC 22490 / CBS 7301 / JCM 7358 / NBRC 10748 / NRRL Y-17804) TaxID=698492 RepID=A0A0E9NBI6_SAICN|nr:alpha/beta-hydrolase [Saitoella complicata NRRL Y-17804]ODQ55222.1 alpha/beta-hydrolase [Saitoella complicata NRRL Y-17804]GAO47056.1 hypothetical protein G7K_1268-t1 [Saitoella complicata NRRL Y-17804]
MDLLNHLQDLSLPPLKPFLTVGLPVIFGTLLIRSRFPLDPAYHTEPAVSPRVTLTKEERDASPYPENFFEGGRYVETPYGTIRTYEFGNAEGPRILLIHGITSPSPCFHALAMELAPTHRILTLDLPGRGYSDAPIDLPYDDRFYTSIILNVLTSVGWVSSTNNDAKDPISVLGYSMGGPIATALVRFMPQLFTNPSTGTTGKLILVAPAGLLHRKSLSLFSRLAISSLLPVAAVTAIQRFFRLRYPQKVEESRLLHPRTLKEKQDAADAYREDEDKWWDIDAISYFQSLTHSGFARAFTSSYRHAPLFNQHDRLFRHPNIQNPKLKVLSIWGAEDAIVPLKSAEEMRECVPKAGVLVFEGAGHDVVRSRAREMTPVVKRFLDGEEVAGGEVEGARWME